MEMEIEMGWLGCRFRTNQQPGLHIGRQCCLDDICGVVRGELGKEEARVVGLVGLPSRHQVCSVEAQVRPPRLHHAAFAGVVRNERLGLMADSTR